MAALPIITGDDLADRLGGTPNPETVALLAEAASNMVAALVTMPADPDPWPAEVTGAALGVGADLYKAATGTGGGYQLDATSYTDVYRMTATFLRRYEPMLATVRATGGMAG